jgi:hypothetical protein
LQAALGDLGTTFVFPMPDLMPRPALFLVAHIASSLFLLEHAVWSHTTAEPEEPLDIEVFCRWVTEGGLVAVIEDVKRAKGSSAKRALADSVIVYGPVKTRL